ncbi:MAG: UMP kinase, partial [Pseudomonadota bacterium]
MPAVKTLPVLKYKRILLKISGEVLMGPREFGMDPDTVARIASDIKEVVEM